MKKLVYTLLLAVSIIGCASIQNKESTNDVKALSSSATSDTLRIANDSLEYEILIIEPGFNQWLVSQMPRGYYEQFWLENRNIFYVTEYNNRVINSVQYNPNLYLQQIDYQMDVDYGYEVNYLLYNWFEFFQERYKQKLR